MLKNFIKDLGVFTYHQSLSCIFPVVIFATLALSKAIQIPGVGRYDFILVICLLTQYLMYKFGLETKDEIKVICLFHIIGLVLELYKVNFNSWSYPEEAWTKIGVCLYIVDLCMRVWQVIFAKPGVGLI